MRKNSYMPIFYEEEHKTCYNYGVADLSSFAIKNLKGSSSPVYFETERSMLCFVEKGSVEAWFGKHRMAHIEEGHFFLVPAGVVFGNKAQDHTQVVCCSFADTPKFCNLYTIETLSKEVKVREDMSVSPVFTLPICERLHSFLELLVACMNDGIQCVHFHQIKVQELFLMLRMYYSKEDLARMFAPILGHDNEFRRFVLDHYKEFVDIKQFASLANMTPSTFQRRFKQMFRLPVSEWLTRRKSELIIREIKTSSKTINEISDEYGFSSVQYFSNFCKRQFGKTPTELRSETF